MANLKGKIRQVRQIIPPPISPKYHDSHFEDLEWASGPDKYTSTVGKAWGMATNFYGQVLASEPGAIVTSGILNKGWRAKLMIKSFKRRSRDRHDKGKIINKGNAFIIGGDSGSKVEPEYGGEVSLKQRSTIIHTVAPYHREDRVPQIVVGRDLNTINLEAKANGIQLNRINLIDNAKPIQKNEVIIYNISALESETSGLETSPYVALQIRPREIDSKAETSWASIKTMGRNTPMYHYLGAEDSVQINTSWYIKGAPGDKDFNPYYVINQCRQLKSWSMSNGYVASPPILYIQWGSSDIFTGELWILTSATYHLSNFKDICIDKYTHKDRDSQLLKDIDIINNGLVPFNATQELIFKRVSSHNLNTAEIYNYQVPIKNS